MLSLNTPSISKKAPLGTYTSIASKVDSDESGLLEKKRIWREKAASALEAAGMISHASEFRLCGRDFLADVCTANYGHHPRIMPTSCHKRYCPECAGRETARKLARYIPAIYDMLAEEAPASWSLKKFELTTPFKLNSSCDADTYKLAWLWVENTIQKITFDVLKAQNMLTPSELRRGRADYRLHKVGALVSAEFGENGRKLHFHILYYGPFLPKDQLTDTWKDVSAGECEITWIRAIPVNQVEDQLKEVTKYVTKFTQLPPALVPVLAKTIKGSRTVRSYGLLHGVKAAEKTSCTCDECGAKRERVAVLQYLQVCQDLNLKLDDEIMRVYEANLHSDLLDLKHGNNSGEAQPVDKNNFRLHTNMQPVRSQQASGQPEKLQAERSWHDQRRWDRWHTQARRTHSD